MSSSQMPKVLGRTDTLKTDDYYMASAVLTSQLSPDPNTQVGACFAKNGRVVGLGCNKFPNGCANRFSWSRDISTPLNAKYLFVIHAELDAMLLATPDDIRDSSLYVTLFLCNECAKIIIQANVKEVIYFSDKYETSDSTIASKQMLDATGIRYRQFIPSKNLIEIHLSD